MQQPDLSPESHSLAITVRHVEAAILFHTMFNVYWEPLVFELPPLRHRHWRRWIDTSRDAPDDVYEWSLAAPVQGPTCAVQPRSLVILFADVGGDTPVSPAPVPATGAAAAH